MPEDSTSTSKVQSSPAAPKRSAAGSERSEWLKIWIPVLVLAVLGFGYAFSRLEPPAPRHLKIAAGGPTGAYYGYAQLYAESLSRQGYELEVVETAGSIDNLKRLSADEVDLAILQGGVASPEANPELEVIAALFLEPMWVFHRAGIPVSHIADLVAMRINIGSEGSGTRALALDLLADNGIDETTTDFRSLSADEAEAALISGEIDAAFFVTSSSAAYIRRLLENEAAVLMPIRRHRAYRIRHPFLSAVTLGEGVVDLDQDLPEQDTPLVAAAASLVANSKLHHALIPLLIQAAEEAHGGGDVFKDAGYFPSGRYLDLPIKTEAAHYLEHGPSFLYRILPYRTATVVDRLKILLLPFIPLLLIVFKMAPPLYRWRIRSKIYRWYEDLRELDHLLLRDPSDQEVDRALSIVNRLEVEVTEVSVPLSYMDEFYNLRVHIALIEKKLAELYRTEP